MKVLRVETKVLANVTCLHIGNAQSADDCAGIREYLLRYGNVLGQGKIKELKRKHYKHQQLQILIILPDETRAESIR